MRSRFWMIGLVLCGAVVGVRAQEAPESAVYAALQHHGSLVIWWVEETTGAQRGQLALEKIIPSVPRIPLDQRSTSELGQNASSYGQNAGSYGQTASTLGTNASNAGQNAGSYGTAASNVGKSASDTGQNAASYGQTASTYGQNASTYGIAASDTDKRASETGPLTLTAPQQQFAAQLRAVFPGVNLRMAAVPDVLLQERLAAAARAGTSPDVVMADRGLPAEWRSIAATAGVAMLGQLERRQVQEFNDQATVGSSQQPAVAILLRAPHPEAARALVTWLREGRQASADRRISDASAPIAEIAVRAATAALSGAAMPAADAAIAQCSPELLQAAATVLDLPAAALAAPLRVDVLDVAANDRFAVVRLRATLGSARSFGLAYPLLTLRRIGGGGWKVLQISVGLTPGEMRHAAVMLRPFTEQGKPLATVAAVSGMQPRDGDTRGPQPEIGWQHGEGGSLFVVEWQMGDRAGTWKPSNLFFVPDEGTRSQTRVNAQFAQANGAHRWRVWTLGEGGALQLSAWQTFVVVGR